jgi:hypothetical protein
MDMTEQEIVDRMEQEAIARFFALRAVFWPCWGELKAGRAGSQRRRVSPARSPGRGSAGTTGP